MSPASDRASEHIRVRQDSQSRESDVVIDVPKSPAVSGYETVDQMSYNSNVTNSEIQAAEMDGDNLEDVDSQEMQAPSQVASVAPPAPAAPPISDSENPPDRPAVDNILANSDPEERSSEDEYITLFLPPKPKKQKSEESRSIPSDSNSVQQEWTQRVDDIRQYFDEWVKNLSELRKNKLPKTADKGGPEVPEPNEEDEDIHHFEDVIQPGFEVSSFELSFGSSHDGETTILPGDSLFHNGERIFIDEILAEENPIRYKGMKRIANTQQFIPVEILSNEKISFEMVRVQLLNH